MTLFFLVFPFRFLVYKTPQDPQDKNEFIAKGVGFYYMDSRQQALTLSPTPINGKDHALYNTLEQIYLNVSIYKTLQQIYLNVSIYNILQQIYLNVGIYNTLQ